MKKLLSALVFSTALFANTASATLMEFTYTSASAGVLGSLVIDDSLFTGSSYQGILGSDIYDLAFSYAGLSFTIADVYLTSLTYIDSSSAIPAVVGGGGYLARGSIGGVWIAGTSFILVGTKGFTDGAWTSSVYAGVPEAGTLGLLALGLLGIGFSRKAKSA